VIGFSLDDAVGRARAKLEKKRLDLIVANPLSTPGSERIRPRLLFRGGRARTLAARAKSDFARELVEAVSGLYRRRRKR
jgi:phosphopantothenoylcysteine synthetase/decarboxylase